LTLGQVEMGIEPPTEPLLSLPYRL